MFASYPCGNTTVDTLPPILRSIYEGYEQNLLTDEDLKEMLAFCNVKKYTVKSEPVNGEEFLTGYKITTNEYSTPPQILRITKICGC